LNNKTFLKFRNLLFHLIHILVVVWRCSNSIGCISDVTPHRSWLVMGWVTIFRQANHLVT